MAVIYALWLRELKRFARSRAQIVSSLGQPLVYFLALGHGLNAIFRRGGAGDYVQFVGPGVIAMAVLFSSMTSGMQLMWDRQFGYLRAILVSPAPRIEIAVGRICGAATAAVAQGTLAGAVCMLAGLRIGSAAAILAGIAFLALIALVFTALGLTIASALREMRTFQNVIQVLLMPVFLLSGALFPLDHLPKSLAVFTWVDPLSYGVDGLRGALTDRAYFGAVTDALVIGVLLASVASVGVWRFSRISA